MSSSSQARANFGRSGHGGVFGSSECVTGTTGGPSFLMSFTGTTGDVHVLGILVAGGGSKMKIQEHREVSLKHDWNIQIFVHRNSDQPLAENQTSGVSKHLWLHCCSRFSPFSTPTTASLLSCSDRKWVTGGDCCLLWNTNKGSNVRGRGGDPSSCWKFVPAMGG